MSTLFGGGSRKWQGDDATWVQRHSLSLFLGGLTLAQTIGAAVAYYFVWVNGWDTAPGKWSFAMFATFFTAAWLTSVLADSYGALLLVLASRWFFEEGSAESNEEQDPRQ
jgi:hypothetical protein